MRSSVRLPIAVIGMAVLLAACYAGRVDVRMGIAVAIAGAGTAALRAVLAIPVSIAMAAVSVNAPGLMATLIVVALAAVPVVLLLAYVIKYPEEAMQEGSSRGAGLL